MATIQLPRDFKEFLKLLNYHEVEYLLIGGYAVNYYGYPRATVDMDIWVGMEPSNAAKAASALREFGFSQASADLFLEPEKIIRMGVPPLRIKLPTPVSGLEFAEAFLNRVVTEIDEVPVNLASLSGLEQLEQSAQQYTNDS